MGLPKSHPNLEKIIGDLTRTVYDWKGNASTIEFFEERSDEYLIPRYYDIPGDQMINQSNIGDDINISSTIVPRNNRQKKAIDFFLKNTSGVLRLEPGSGKTVITIASICFIKKKTIIFVHKDSLSQQWKKEFIDHTSIKEEDIGILDSSSVKNLLKSVENKNIIIATIQSMLWIIKDQDKLNIINNCGLGMAVFDESHVAIGPAQFSKVALNINCLRVYGLSATPRTDGLEDIISYFIGAIQYFEAEENELLIPKINVIKFNFGVVSRYKKYINWGNSFNISKYYKQLKKSDKYINTITELILKAYKENRNILVLGTRVDNLLLFAQKINLPKSEIGFFVPTSTEEQRLSVSDTIDLKEAFNEKRVVFSTAMAARDGVNRKNLDCLIMTVGISNVEQAAGRILRTLEGKPKAIIFDIVDSDPTVPSRQSYLEPTIQTTKFIRQYEQRYEFYISKHWEVHEFELE